MAYTVTVPVISDGHFRKEHLLEELRRCKADRVALAVNRELRHKFSSPATLERLKEMIGYYRSNGFPVAVWVGETLGHDQVTRLPDGCETPYRRMRLPGKGTVASFCPTDERFINDLCAWVERLAALRPDLILLDDDFRLNGGCCCAEHVERLNRAADKTLTADEWAQNAFCGGKNRLRDVWMQVQGETLYTLAYALREAVDRIDPTIRLGLCATHLLWDADGVSAERLVRILAGGTKPLLRTFGAPYHALQNRFATLGAAAELERWQFHLSKSWGIERIAEGDTYPRPRFYCPASYLECFDQILRADGCGDGILKYAVDYASDTFYERGYTDAWAKNLPLYEQIDALFEGKTAVGVVPYLCEHLLQNAVIGANEAPQPLRFSAGTYSPAAELAVMNNLPTAYDGTGVRLVFGENARQIPLDELRYGGIIDLPAARILRERGLDVGFFEPQTDETPAVSYLNGAYQYFREEDEYVRISGVAFPPALQWKKNGTQVLTEFVSENLRLPGWVRRETAEGLRLLILPLDGRDVMGKSLSGAGYLNGYALRRMLIRQIPWLNGAPPDAFAEGNPPPAVHAGQKRRRIVERGALESV